MFNTVTELLLASDRFDEITIESCGNLSVVEACDGMDSHRYLCNGDTVLGTDSTYFPDWQQPIGEFVDEVINNLDF